MAILEIIANALIVLAYFFNPKLREAYRFGIIETVSQGTERTQYPRADATVSNARG